MGVPHRAPVDAAGEPEDTATRILAAATRALAEDPKASMSDVAVASGVGRATLYRHFASRDELLGAIRLQALGELGSTYLLREDYARGVEYLKRAFTIAAEAGLASDAALFARNLAAAYVPLEQWDDAAHYNQEAARFATSAGATSPYALITEARIAAGRGHSETAARLFGQASSDEKAMAVFCAVPAYCDS